MRAWLQCEEVAAVKAEAGGRRRGRGSWARVSNAQEGPGDHMPQGTTRLGLQLPSPRLGNRGGYAPGHREGPHMPAQQRRPPPVVLGPWLPPRPLPRTDPAPVGLGRLQSLRLNKAHNGNFSGG